MKCAFKELTHEKYIIKKGQNTKKLDKQTLRCKKIKIKNNRL